MSISDTGIGISPDYMDHLYDAFTTDRDNVFNAGCDDYMSKPINIKKLLGKISKYCS